MRSSISSIGHRDAAPSAVLLYGGACVDPMGKGGDEDAVEEELCRS